MDKHLINNELMRMKTTIQRAKVCIINKLVKRSRSIKKQIGISKKEKLNRKNDRITEKIQYLKTINNLKMAKLMLTYAKDPKKIKTNPLSSSVDVANAMIYEFKGVQQKITEIKSKFQLLFNNKNNDDDIDNANDIKNIKTKNKTIKSSTKGTETKNTNSNKLIELIEKNGKKKEQKLRKIKQRMVMEKRKKEKLKHREMKRKRSVWLEENLPITAAPINNKINNEPQHDKDGDDGDVTPSKKKQNENENKDVAADNDNNKKQFEPKSKDSFFIKQNGDIYMSTIPKSKFLIDTDKNLNPSTKKVSDETHINNKRRHTNQFHNDTIDSFESQSKNNFKTNHYNNNWNRNEMVQPVKINKFNAQKTEGINNSKTTSTTSTATNDELIDLHPSWIAAKQKKKQDLVNSITFIFKFAFKSIISEKRTQKKKKKYPYSI